MNGQARWEKSRPARGEVWLRRRGRGWIARLAVWLAVVCLTGGTDAADSKKPVTVSEDDPDVAPAEPAAGSGKPADTTERIKPPNNRNPILLKGVPAEYPKEFVGSGLNADVVVTLLVDRMGRASHIRVEGSPDPAFTDAALQALAQYEFLPAIKNGRITNASVQMTLPVREELGNQAFMDFEGGKIELITTTTASKADTPIKRIFGPRPAYPIEMLAAAKSGEVVVEFLVGDDGVPYNTKVIESTYVEFARAVEGAIALWRYSPALAGAQPVTAGLRYRVSFEAADLTETMRAMAKRLLAGDTSDFVPSKQLDSEPRVRSRIEPSAPAGRDGSDRHTRRVDVAFMVDAKGMVRLPRVIKASDPISGYIALAAVNYWTFEPAKRKNEPVPVLVVIPFRF